MTRMYRWVHFIGDTDESKVSRYITSGTDHLNRYRVRQVVPIRGEPPTLLSEGMYGLRYETSVPPSFLTRGTSLGQSPKMHFWGVAQHLHYTNQKERIDLEAHSHPELAPSEHTIAVLIPIRKSAAWWDLSQDDRQEFFHQKAGQEGHVAIGARYVDCIFRKLYHCRYLDPMISYDFLTYFEFEEHDEKRFRMLLSELRDLRKNPEWYYIEHEYEIWMTKVK